MPSTRAFKSGNSQAVRIPAELAFTDISGDLTITRSGDVVTIFPARDDLRQAVQQLREMRKPSEVEVMLPIEMPDRA